MNLKIAIPALLGAWLSLAENFGNKIQTYAFKPCVLPGVDYLLR